MNAHTFDSHHHHAATCPICRRTGGIKPVGMIRGLLACQYCRERLVFSSSGHYVRDPFTLEQLAISKMIRRQSRPFARILRDFSSTGYLSLIALLGSAFFLGLVLLQLPDAAPRFPTQPGLLQSNQHDP